jgi:hypothetical protein
MASSPRRHLAGKKQVEVMPNWAVTIPESGKYPDNFVGYSILENKLIVKGSISGNNVDSQG